MNQKNFTPIEDLIKKFSPTTKTSAKEIEPVLPTRLEIKEVEEFELEKEVAPYIQKRPESIELPPDLKKIGLRTTPVPIQTPTLPSVKLPIADDKIISGLHAPITSSLRWLATLAIYLLKRAHLGLKVVHGQVVRVLKKK